MILVGTPVHKGSAHLLPSLLENWRAWPSDERVFVIIYNGRLDGRLLTQIRQWLAEYPELEAKLIIQPTGYLIWWFALCRAQERMRQLAVRGNYSHLLFHEVSRLPNSEGSAQLINYGLPVVGALYKDTYHPGYYCVYDFDEQHSKLRFEPYLHIDSITKPQPVGGIGFGFTLIRRDVFTKVRFRCMKYAADTYFCLDLKRLGIVCYAAPTYLSNVKIDGDPSRLAEWLRAREQLTAKAGSKPPG